MSTMDDLKPGKSMPEKIRRSVKALRNMPFEDRIQLFVRAGLMSQEEASQKVSEKKSKDEQVRPNISSSDQR